MARGWGNAPPDLKGTLGTLLRTTLIQLGSLRDVAVRELRAGSRELANRAPSLVGSGRTEVLASLGEIIYELAKSGELDLDDFPELASAIAELESIDSSFNESFNEPFNESFNESFDGSSGEGFAVGGPKRRSTPAEASASPVWRPDPADYDDDGTRRMASSEPQSSIEGARPSRPSRPSASGHIAFVPDDGVDSDDDLAEYMHEDDVPNRD